MRTSTTIIGQVAQRIQLAPVLVVLILATSGCSRKPTEPVAVDQTPQRPPTPAAARQTEPPEQTTATLPGGQQAPPLPPADVLAQKGTPGRAPLIENPAYTPTPPTMGLAFDAVAKRLESALKGVERRSPEAAHKVAELWNAAAAKSLNQPTGSEDGAVNAGIKLPAEISALRRMSDKEMEVLLLNGSLPFAQTNEEFEAAVSGLLLSTSATVSGLAALPTLLGNRAESLPPTREDVMNFFAVSQGLRELKSLSVGASTLEEWKPLSTARNPVYRLLALLAAQKATTTETQFTSSESPSYAKAVLPERLAFYRDYLNEKDPLILAATLEAIGNVSLPEARVILEDFRNRQLSVGNAELASLSDAAIRSCEANLRWSSVR